MLASAHRLRKSSDIARVYRHGRRSGSAHLLFRANPNRVKETRFAVVVGKKVDKRAVVRNRCRRQVQEALRALVPDVKPGFDILVSINTDVRAVPRPQLDQEVQQTLRRLGMLAS